MRVRSRLSLFPGRSQSRQGQVADRVRPAHILLIRLSDGVNSPTRSLEKSIAGKQPGNPVACGSPARERRAAFQAQGPGPPWPGACRHLRGAYRHAHRSGARAGAQPRLPAGRAWLQWQPSRTWSGRFRSSRQWTARERARQPAGKLDRLHHFGIGLGDPIDSPRPTQARGGGIFRHDTARQAYAHHSLSLQPPRGCGGLALPAGLPAPASGDAGAGSPAGRRLLTSAAGPCRSHGSHHCR